VLPSRHAVGDHRRVDVPIPRPTASEHVVLELSPPFGAAGEHIAVDLPGAQALFTTRRGGVSGGPYESLNLGQTATDAAPGDDPRLVAANRSAVIEQVADGSHRFAHGRQVHGHHVARVTSTPTGDWEAVRPGAHAADGQATALHDVAAVVLVADCLPVAIAGEGAVAMIHAGWRGLAGGVIEAGVRALGELGAAPPLAAAIGPGVGGCCYEVGVEVHEALADLDGADLDGELGNGRRIDLKAVAAARLRAAGVADVHDVGLCTLCGDPSLLFSHRRGAGRTGRQAGIVWRR